MQVKSDGTVEERVSNNKRSANGRSSSKQVCSISNSQRLVELNFDPTPSNATKFFYKQILAITLLHSNENGIFLVLIGGPILAYVPKSLLARAGTNFSYHVLKRLILFSVLKIICILWRIQL